MSKSRTFKNSAFWLSTVRPHVLSQSGHCDVSTHRRAWIIPVWEQGGIITGQCVALCCEGATEIQTGVTHYF